MKRNELALTVRECVLANFYGVLSTQGQAYPVGSLVRYALDDYGQPLLLLSRIAEHTSNLHLNHNVSLFILTHSHENIQECARVTLMGKLEQLKENSGNFDFYLKHYFACFPETQDYFKNLDFDLYQLQVEDCRYIGGFAAAHRLNGIDFRLKNILEPDACEQILSHMNADHGDAIVHYCKANNFELKAHVPQMVAIDAHGFQIRIGPEIKRIRFKKPITDRVSAREALVALAKN